MKSYLSWIVLLTCYCNTLALLVALIVGLILSLSLPRITQKLVRYFRSSPDNSGGGSEWLIGSNSKEKGLNMNKYRVTLEIEDLDNQYLNAQQLEGYLIDTITPALNALGVQRISSSTTKKRG